MYRAGVMAAWRALLTYFVTWHHNITRQMKETDVRDVNNSDSGPWNIWCRNLIYFKSSTVLWLSKTKQWNFELRSELKVTVRVKNISCIFWPVISGLGPVTLIWCHVSGGHWVSSLSLVIIPSPHRWQTRSNLLLPSDLIQLWTNFPWSGASREISPCQS